VPPTELVPTYSTAVNTWQCDENDHLNVQFYTEFAHEASVHLMTALGLGPRAQADRGLAVRVTEDHIRYLREFRINDAVEVRSAPVDIGERHLLAYHEVRNAADGTVASTIRRRITSGQPWPDTFRAHAMAAAIALPASAQPRSVGTLSLPALVLADARRTGLVEVGRSVVKSSECDERGELLPRHQFGRYSNAAPALWSHAGFDRTVMQERRHGSIVVEVLQHYRAPLHAGDPAVLMSGLADFTDKTLKFAHFLFEAETGTLAACAEAVGMMFDQKIRKIVTFSADDRVRLSERKRRLFA
jgi:acyl-CoA thioester hydrolase